MNFINRKRNIIPFILMYSITFSQIPNLVQSISYNSEYDQSDANVTTEFYNGRGRIIGKLLELENGDLVEYTLYDKLGRLKYKTLPFYSQSHYHYWMNIDLNQALNMVNNYYDGSTSFRPNSGDGVNSSTRRAYFEYEYLSNPLQKVFSTGKPGYFNSLSGKVSKTYTFGVKNLAFDNNLNSSSLLTKKSEMNSKYLLTVTKDENDNIFQSLTDLDGNVVANWSDKDGGASNEIIQRTYYDYSNRPTKVLQPGINSQPNPNIFVEYKYDMNSNVLYEKSKDFGIVQSAYDEKNRIVFTIDELQMSRSTSGEYYVIYTLYDENNRIKEVGKLFNTPLLVFQSNNSRNSIYQPQRYFNDGFKREICTEYIYDDSDDLFKKHSLKYDDLFGLSNLYGKLVSEIQHVKLYDVKYKVFKIYSYDEDERIQKTIEIVPFLPVQTTQLSYNLNGTLRHKRIGINSNEGSTITDWLYEYNRHGQIKNIRKGLNSNKYIEFNYFENNVLSHINVYDQSGYKTTTLNYVSDILGRTKTISATTGSSGYTENITYNEGIDGGYFNGNVYKSSKKYKINSNPEINYLSTYLYDKSNRLTNSQSATSSLNESFTYSPSGRIESKVSSNEVSGTYEYYSNTNRLMRIVGGGGRGDVNGNYVYDPSGNIVLDRSKKMSIEYDYRGLPIKFIFYNTIPSRQITWQEVGNLPDYRTEVQMIYDANGNRVLKVEKQ